jgi:hypothetical protein
MWLLRRINLPHSLTNAGIRRLSAELRYSE